MKLPAASLAWLLLAVCLSWGCGNGSDDDDANRAGSTSVAGGSGGASGSGAAGTPSGGTAGSGASGGGAGGSGPDCTLNEAAGNPVLAISGTACGQTIDFTASAGRLIRLSRSSLTHPLTQITAIVLKDDASNVAPSLPEYFSEFGFLFNVASSAGPELALSSAAYDVQSGLLIACDFGSLALGESQATIAIESLQGQPEGQISMSLSNLAVAGFTSEFGLLEVPACDGSVNVTLTGAYRHDPG